MSGETLRRYRARVENGTLEPDEAQSALAEKFDALATRLDGYRLVGKTNLLGRWLGAKPAEPPRGLYVWGEVGRGKTFLMDLFYEAATATPKRRVHFHAFMADVHRRIHAWRQSFKAGEVHGGDPIVPVAAALAAEASLLCFDEFAVRDIADAMILARLFGALFALGVVVVATSNVAPADLYRDGLNRALFLPFLDLLAARMDVVELSARTDYRLQKLSRAPVYYCPADASADAAMDAAFLRLAGVSPGVSRDLPLLGRTVHVPQAANGVARFTFDDLCRRPLAAADYLEIAREFATVLVERIPRLVAQERNEAKRFIMLIDAFYDAKVKLVASAAAEPEALGAALVGAEKFEFARTASRLVEMRSLDYLSAPRGVGKENRDLGGLVET